MIPSPITGGLSLLPDEYLDLRNWTWGAYEKQGMVRYMKAVGVVSAHVLISDLCPELHDRIRKQRGW